MAASFLFGFQYTTAFGKKTGHFSTANQIPGDNIHKLVTKWSMKKS